MRVLLVHPPMPNARSSKVFPPLGLAYLAGTLQGVPNTEVRIHNGQLDQVYYHQTADEMKKHLQDAIRAFSPDVVGISNSFTSLADDATATASWVREATDAPILMGGAHVSVCYEEVLRNGAADAVVIGEGEATLVEVLSAIEHGGDLSAIPGVAVLRDGQVVCAPRRPLIENLDTIPMPAWGILPMDRYFSLNSPALNMRLPKTIMSTSRGCLGSCIYCAAHKIWGRRTWRGRSPENVLQEIEFLHHTYGVREFDFEDDNMAADPERLANICQLILDRKLDIRWKCPGGIGHWTLTPALLTLMHASGCYRLTLGIETASPERRRSIGKTWDLRQAEEIIGCAHDLGMWTNATFMIGFPEDDRESVLETVRWFDRSNLDFASFFVPVPLPGTPLTRIYEKLGYDVGRETIKTDDRPYATEHLTREEMAELYDRARRLAMKRLVRRFANPMNLLKKIRSWEDLRYVLGLMGFAGSLLWARRSVQEVKIGDAQQLS